MQLAATRFAKPVDPALAREIVTGAIDEIDRLDAKLRFEHTRNYHVSREWPGEVGTLASRLRSAGNAVDRLGVDGNSAVAGARLLEAASGVDAFAREMASAYAAHTAFGPSNAGWLTAFVGPAAAAREALDLLQFVAP